MPIQIQNEVTERISVFSGIKSSLPFGVLNSSDAEDILNFVSRRGKLRKIWGASLYYTSGLSDKQIGWLEHFRYKWIAQHGNTIIREATEGQADFASIGDIQLGSQNRVFSEKWENRLYLSNGVENKFLEDSITNQNLSVQGQNFITHGLIPPGLGQRISNYLETSSDYAQLVISEQAASGTGLANGTLYYYLITWYDSVRNVESLPNGSEVGEDGLWVTNHGARRGFTTTGANKALKIDWSALKALGYDTQRVTHVRVYRATQADFTTYKCVNISSTLPDGPYGTPIAQDSYADETVEANLGQVLDESLSPPPSGLYYRENPPNDTVGVYGPKFTKFFRDQIWKFGVEYPGTEYGFEAVSETVAAVLSRKVNYFPQSGIAYASGVNEHEYFRFTYGIGRASGQKDTGMAKFRNTLMFFKERSAYYLSGSSPDNYEIQEMDANRGILVSGSLKETTIGPIGLSVDGFTLFDGVGPGKPISDEIFDKIQEINLDYHDKINSVFDPIEEKYECHAPIGEFSWNVRVFTFDCKTKCWEVTDRAGGAAAYGVGSNRRTVSLLGDSRNGRLYRTDDYSAVTFNDKTMHARWKSRAFDFGRPGDLKNVQFVEIVASCIKDFRINVDLIVDFGQGDAVVIEDHPPDLREGEWCSSSNDSSNLQWNSGQWEKGVRKKKFTILMQAIGKNFNLIVKNSDSDANRASFEIEEIIVHANLVDGDTD